MLQHASLMLLLLKFGCLENQCMAMEEQNHEENIRPSKAKWMAIREQYVQGKESSRPRSKTENSQQNIKKKRRFSLTAPIPSNQLTTSRSDSPPKRRHHFLGKLKKTKSHDDLYKISPKGRREDSFLVESSTPLRDFMTKKNRHSKKIFIKGIP